MGIRQYKLFPTPVLEYDDFISTEECNEIKKIISNNKHLLKEISLIQKGKSTHSLECFLSHINKNKLKEKIIDLCIKYAEDVGYILRGEMSNSWFNVEGKNSKLFKHAHALSTLSVVVYINVDKDSSNLIFYNPHSYVLRNTMSKRNTEFTYDHIEFKPKNGKLLLFPSWLVHGTENNKTKNRIVLGCNVL
jgi:uncharacterized protein (TIGR02466 family)|tara:strand:+ start:294 stop:866 length:573 start_codon:yes stop_codon:yes gene_type:complete